MGVFVSIFGTISPMVTLKYEHAIPVAADDKQAVTLMGLALGIAVIISGITTALGSLVVPRHFSGPIPTVFAEYGWLLAPGLFFSALFTTGTFWMIRKKKYSRIARARVEQSLSKVVLELFFGVLAASPLGLICGHLASQIGGTRTVLRDFWANDRSLISHVGTNDLKSVAKEHKNFPLYTMPAAGLNALGANAPLILIPIVFNEMSAGLFLVAQRLSAWPTTLIANSLGQVFYGAIANSSTTSVQTLRLFRKLTATLMLIGLAMIAVLGTAPIWANHFLGEKWANAGWVITILAPMMAVRLLVTPMSHAYNLHSKQRLFLLIETTRVVLTAGVFIFSMTANYSFLTTISLFSIFCCANYIAHWIAINQILSHAARTEKTNAQTLF
ncbi:MAG: hypothetical protein CMJ47_04510 [Planctomyces sp.]|nr:hypothetical protein [Planctomyces sp.]